MGKFQVYCMFRFKLCTEVSTGQNYTCIIRF